MYAHMYVFLRVMGYAYEDAGVRYSVRTCIKKLYEWVTYAMPKIIILTNYKID